MNLSIVFYFLLYLGAINSIQIKLNSFSEIVLPKGTSELIYNYSYPYDNKNIEGSYLYFFIKVSDYSKINRIYELRKRENNKEEMKYIYIPQKKDEWISTSLESLYDKMLFILHIETTEKNLKLKQFLNLNLITSELYFNVYPLLFNIKSDSSTLFSVRTQEIINFKFFKKIKASFFS